MTSGTLYCYPDDFKAFKGLIAAEYSGVKVKVLSSPPDFVPGETNSSPEFLAKFPLGKVPAFESVDGKCFADGNAIAVFLAGEQLRGKTLDHKTEIQQWISFADNEILPSACTWVFPYLGLMPFNKQTNERAKTDLRRVLQVLNDHLNRNTFLVGERISLADICCCCNLILAFKHVLDPEYRVGLNNLTRWFVTIVNQAEVKRVVGEVVLCSKPASFDAKAVSEFAASAGRGEGRQRSASGRKSESKSAEIVYRYDESTKERTFIMVKPDGVQRGLVGEIIKRFERRGGLKLVALKFVVASLELLQQHYADLAAKPFFKGMVAYMASGPVVPMVWEGLNAAKIGRMLLGETDPQKSLPGTIRGDFCLDIGRNLLHGSDSVDSAAKEIKLWFGNDLSDWAPASQFHVYEPKMIEESKKGNSEKKKPSGETKKKEKKMTKEELIAEAMEEYS